MQCVRPRGQHRSIGWIVNKRSWHAGRRIVLIGAQCGAINNVRRVGPGRGVSTNAHRQRPVDVADRVVRQTGAHRTARGDRIRAHRRAAGSSGAGQGHTGDGVTIHQAAGDEVRRAQVQCGAEGFALVPCRDAQRRRGHHQSYREVCSSVVGIRRGEHDVQGVRSRRQHGSIGRVVNKGSGNRSGRVVLVCAQRCAVDDVGRHRPDHYRHRFVNDCHDRLRQVVRRIWIQRRTADARHVADGPAGRGINGEGQCRRRTGGQITQASPNNLIAYIRGRRYRADEYQSRRQTVSNGQSGGDGRPEICHGNRVIEICAVERIRRPRFTNRQVGDGGNRGRHRRRHVVARIGIARR